MNNLAYIKQSTDNLLKDLKAAATWESNCIEYSFTSSETAEGLHLIACGRLQAAGISHELKVTSGRGARKGFQYAKVMVFDSPVKTEASQLEEAILNKWAIRTECSVTSGGIVIGKVRDGHSAATILKGFRRHNVRAIATEWNEFNFFVPTTNVRQLMS